MVIQQISVFVENQPGRLGEIMSIISDNEIDIRALSLADTSDFGILRILVNDPEKAIKLFREKRIMASTTEVIAVRLDDKPGALQHVLSTLSHISIEYIYAFITRRDNDAYVIIRVEDNDKAINVLQKNSLKLLDPKDVCDI